MLTLNGQVLNVLNVPEYTDKKTGVVTPARFRVQLMGQTLTQQGENKAELVNLTVMDATPYRALLGQQARVPVGIFVAQGVAQFYAIKGAKPEAIAPATGAAGAQLRAHAAPDSGAAGRVIP